MKRLNRLFIFLSVCFALVLLADCKHDPPVTPGVHTDPDSLYVGRAYTFKNNSAGFATYRQVQIPASNPETYEGIQLGRMLFYDSTLSLNHQVSCGSCHKQEFSFGDNQKLSQNVHGSTARNASALMNLGVNNIFFWDGRQATIEDAVKDALTNEQSPDINTTINYLDSTTAYTYLFKKAFGRPATAAPLITQDKIVKAIAQFVRTLVCENSRFDQLKRGDRDDFTPSERNGMEIFFDQKKGDCTHCHTDAPYLTLALIPAPMKNNALDTIADGDFNGFSDKGFGAVTLNASDNGKFKIPNLRNVEVSAPYMHDGRFTTLEQIANHYGTRDSLKRSPTVDALMERFIDPTVPDLDQQQKTDLVAFLKTLTDTSFLHNPNFANPFHH